MGSIRNRGRLKWEIRVGAGKDPATGKYLTVREMIYGTREDAEKRLRQVDKDVKSGKRKAPTARTVNHALDIWLEELVRLDRAPYTVHSYRQRADRDIRPAIGDRKLDSLTTADLQRFYGTLAKRDLGPRSIRYIHVIMSQCLAEAIRAGWLTVNVAREARLTEDRGRKKKKATNPAVVEQLIAAAQKADLAALKEKKHNPGLALLLRVAAVAGLRRGEICALRRKDIVLEDKGRSSVIVDGALSSVPGYGVTRKGTKTETVRVVPIDDETAQLLREHLERQEKRAADHGLELAEDAWLFGPAVDGTKPLLPDTLSHRFQELCADAKVKGVTIQTLRSWCSSVLADEGVDDAVTAARLGHSATYTTRGHYIRPFSESEAKAADVVARRLDG